MQRNFYKQNRSSGALKLILWKRSGRPTLFIAKKQLIVNEVYRGISFNNHLYGGSYEAVVNKSTYVIFNDNSKNENINDELKEFKGISPRESSLYLVKIDENGIQSKTKILDNSELKGMCQVSSYIKLNDKQVLFFVKTNRTITKKMIITLS